MSDYIFFCETPLFACRLAQSDALHAWDYRANASGGGLCVSRATCVQALTRERRPRGQSRAGSKLVTSSPEQDGFVQRWGRSRVMGEDSTNGEKQGKDLDTLHKILGICTSMVKAEEAKDRGAGNVKLSKDFTTPQAMSKVLNRVRATATERTSSIEIARVVASHSPVGGPTIQKSTNKHTMSSRFDLAMKTLQSVNRTSSSDPNRKI